MNTKAFIVIAVLLLAIVVLASMVFSFSGRIETLDKSFKATLAAMDDSLVKARQEEDSLRQYAPGLGEFMSSIQLHISKLWFAGHASNWGLASYELGELGEAVEGAEALHAKRDSVNVTGVLQSLQNTQLATLKESIASKQRAPFVTAYNETLDGCNGCHRAAGYGFIHIVTPNAPPVTNQRWEPEKN